MKKTFNIILFTFLLTSPIYAQPSFSPEQAVREFHKRFEPLFLQENTTFNMEVEEEGYGLAWVWRTKNNSWVFISRDAFSEKFPFPTKDALYGILCHEIAHLRSPYFQVYDVFGPDLPIASEPESDYFSTYSCLREVFAKTPEDWSVNARFLEREKLKKEYEFLLDACEGDKVCVRSALSAYQGLQNARFYRLSSGRADQSQEISFLTPADAADSLDYKSRPSDQCRLDTLLAGSLRRSRPSCWHP
ncbi:MAG: hypothetical protein WD025_00895 [Bacteriovoracaceae bacterium]